MDNNLILQQFGEIEQKIETLIAFCRSLEATNVDLKNKIRILEEELQDKIEAENNHIEEKSLIVSKIDGLLIKLKDVSEVH